MMFLANGRRVVGQVLYLLYTVRMKIPKGFQVVIFMLGAVIVLPRLFAQPAGRQNAVFPSLDVDSHAGELARRAENGVYTWRDLTDIALWASGAERSSRNRGGASYRDIVIAAAEELLASPDLPRDAQMRGDYVLGFAHRKFLKGYVETQTRLDEIIDTGRYNCVSSAVLYAILAAAADLDVRGVMTRDHAFITVDTGTNVVDVETTNPYGFDPGSRREFHDAFGKLTGFAYVPSRNYQDRANISLLELCSLILSNRIADLEKRNRYAEAVPLAVNRAALLAGRKDPVSSPFFQDGEKDLLDRLLNYGASLVNGGRETDALVWAGYAGSRYPGGKAGEKRWREFTFTALNNLTVRLVRAGKTADARAALDRYGAGLGPSDYNKLDSQLLDAELLAMANGLGKTAEAAGILAAIDRAAHDSRLPAARITELRNFVIIGEGNRLAKTQAGGAAAIAYTEEAIAHYGRNVHLDEALKAHRQNRIADLHNRFARLFNSKNYKDALSHIGKALEEFPDNRQLQQDLNLAEQALRR
jgi:tetratricopeptide (TPR) repeat protein